MIEQIILGLVCVFVGALLSFTITIMTTKNIQKAIAKEMTRTHEKVHHKKSVDMVVKEHKNNCTASKKFSSIKTCLIYLVTKNGGNPQEMGLD